MQPCPSNMIRHSFPDLHQLNLQAPASFDVADNNFLDNLLVSSLPSGQWPDLPGAELAGDSGIAVFDQNQMLPAAEFVNGGYHNGVVSRDGSAFNSFPDQTNFTGQSPVPSGLDSACDGGGGGTSGPTQTKKKVRAKRGQATDPHSIAERLRRVRISERMKSLQELVPNANRADKASMLDEIIEYVKFLQVQVKLLSASRLGGASSAVNIPSQEIGGSKLTANGRQDNGDQASTEVSNLTVTEQRVAKLMEEDMGSAMQYLQGKGLCLMPISLAATISTATGSSRGMALS